MKEYLIMAILLATSGLACDYSFNQDSYKPNDTIVFQFDNCEHPGTAYRIQWIDMENRILSANSGNLSVNNTEVFKPTQSVSGIINLQSQYINDNIIFKVQEQPSPNYLAPVVIGGVMLLGIILLGQQIQVRPR